MKAMLLAAIVVLGGCVLTPEQQRERFEAEVQHMREAYGPGCLAFGLERSEIWVRCVMAAHDRALAARAAAGLAFGAAMQSYGNTRYGPEATRAQQFPVQPMPVYRAPIQCQTMVNVTTCQ